jgi:rod shape determining protein RodA
VLVLLVAFLILILRCLWISAGAITLFSRLLAGSIALSIFTYVFVNIGMVSGILPVVGIPLPFISYGGTSMLTMGLSLGMVMSIARQRGFLMHRAY